MANRDLTNFRTVISQVASNKDEILGAGAEMFEGIIRQNEEAKITQGISDAQLQLSALEADYKLKWQADPTGGMDQYKRDRQGIFDGIGKNISPLYNRTWRDATQNISNRNDATQQAWALKQTHTNSVRSIDQTMKNNFMQSEADGQAFGLDDDAEIPAFVNFATSAESLLEFGNKNLGEVVMGDLMDTYEEDYMKSFISGVSETNPLKALQIMEDDRVRDSFANVDQYSKMRDAIENRAMNFKEIQAENDILGVLKDSNNLLTQTFAGNENLSYGKLQTELERIGASDAVKDFFEQANGYKGANKKKLSVQEKDEFKIELSREINRLAAKDDISSSDLSAMQDKIYEGMTLGALTRKQGEVYLTGMMTPIVDQKQRSLEQFSQGKFQPFSIGTFSLPFVGEVGGQGKRGFVKRKGGNELDDILSQVNVTPKKGEELGPVAKMLNNRNSIELMELYQESLTDEAAKKGLQMGDLLDDGKVSPTEQREIFSRSVNSAKRTFFTSRYPELLEQDEMPSRIIDGDQDIKTNFATKGRDVVSGGGKDTLTFDSAADVEEFAKKSGLPDGAKVLVGGVLMEWNN